MAGTDQSIFRLLDKPSYSGTDIRVFARVYDAGAFERNIRRGWENIASKENAAGLAEEELSNADKHFRNAEIANIEVSRLSENNNNASLIHLEELQTLSLSLFREKLPVRSCGSVNARGYTRGPRTIAGSMIFTTFDEHVLSKLMLAAGSQNNDIDVFALTSTTLSDQLPPIDLQVEFANEYGDSSIEVIYGVEFVNDGHTMSIEDLLLENTFQYVARDIDHMRTLQDQRVANERQLQFLRRQGTTGSQLLRNPNIREYLARGNPF